ncbi:MAG: EamA family transporter [Solirubrobacterales bacterium]
MLSIALALVSAASWGTGDFLGGMAARRYALVWVLAAASFGGLVLATVASFASGQPFPPADDVALAAAAGLAGLVALAAFYNALAIGTMSIVAPISATGTAIPVLWGIAARGEDISVIAGVGIIVLLGGVILASREQDAAATGEAVPVNHRLSVLLALVAAVGFGTIFVLIAESSGTSQFWPSAILKAASLVGTLLVIAVIGRRIKGTRPSHREWLFPVSVGFFDVTANITYASATHRGQIAIASVVAAMYPVVTVLLAQTFLKERMAPSQKVGVVLALVGVLVLAAS